MVGFLDVDDFEEVVFLNEVDGRFIRKIIIFALMALMAPGCTMSVSISPVIDPTKISPPSFDKLTSVENVSASSTYSLTAASGFKVKQSAGILVNKQMTTTQNGYRIYLNLNGRITSGESIK